MIRSGSICMSFLYNYLTTDINLDYDKRESMISCLSKTLANKGGVLSKLSQIISYAEGDTNNNVFDNCKPYKSKKTVNYLKNMLETELFEKHISFCDLNIYKSGSIGQVHKAILKNGHHVIIKVQYRGLEKQCKEDLQIISKVIQFLYNGNKLTNAIIDLKTKLYEELDYTIEYKNQESFFNLWKNDDSFVIAELIPELSSDKILCMKYVEGESLHDFIISSSPEQKQKIGYNIYKFIFTNIFKNQLFYSDIHYGNFLIQNKEILCVMDFGCINYIDDELLKNLIELLKSIHSNDKEKFYDVVKEMKIYNDSISLESKEYMYEYFHLQIKPFLSENFEFTDEWLSRAVVKNIDLMNEWYLPPNLAYLNKICYGLIHILVKLQVKENFLKLFQELYLF
jgi:predicted unusual protein kinase regulating ubiquinone biosynthesis (AarF/ABC1/UbiB family)